MIMLDKMAELVAGIMSGTTQISQQRGQSYQLMKSTNFKLLSRQTKFFLMKHSKY